MQSKGAKKNLKLVNEPTTRKYAKESKNALNLNYYVMARMKPDAGEDEHLKAKIIECRIKKGVDPQGELTKDSYEYYLHFCSMDRRMDRWIPSELIKTTNDYIEDERKKKEDKDGVGGDHDGSSDEHEGLDQNSRIAHEEATKLKTIFKVKFGRYYSETWYYSPYPDEYHDIDCIYYCEFCLSFYVSENELKRHIKTCKLVHPPGNQIYIDPVNKLSVWEIDASRNFTYCENLSFLSKLFLDHKLLLYSMDMFLYFCLCEYDEYGHHLVGYFSKNKYFTDGCNLSCILTLPFYQRKGFGKMLITLSYELSQIENKIGSPERPLSDLGKQSYIAWWCQRIVEYIRVKKKEKQTFTLKQMSEETYITIKDIQDALERFNLIKKHHNQVYLCTDDKVLDEVYKQCGRPSTKIIRENLHWVPYSGRDPASISGLPPS
jgi:GNAT superfamily N-acetyltransferase